MSTSSRRLDQILADGRADATRALGEARAAELGGRARARLVALEATAPRLRKSMNRSFFMIGPSVLAIYQALREDLGLDQAPALCLTEDMLLAFQRKWLKTSPLLGAVMSATFQLRPVRSLFMRSLSAREPGGFHFEKVDDPEALMAFDARDCAIVNFARQHGAPEIVPMICRLDELSARSLHGIELRRTGTIGAGAERCDFRYVKIKR